MTLAWVHPSGLGGWDYVLAALAYYGPWILLGLAVGVILWAWWRTTGRPK